jgi:hypothetical protein
MRVNTRKRRNARRVPSLSEFRAFSVFIDTVHRTGQAFMVALGIDAGEQKQMLGFWEGLCHFKLGYFLFEQQSQE